MAQKLCPGETQCVQLHVFNLTHETVIIRGCYDHTNVKKCFDLNKSRYRAEQDSSFGRESENACHICEGNLCNSSEILKSIIALVIICSLFWKYFNKLF